MFEPIELPLHLPIGAPFPVSVIDAEPALSRYTIRVRLSSEQWATVDGLELFNLMPETRHPGHVGGTDGVEVELRLADELVRDVITAIAGMDPADSVAEVAALDPTSPVFSTESWFATTVTEPVALPADLAGQGELREGFSTTWNDAETVTLPKPEITETSTAPIDPQLEPWPPLLGAIRTYLEERDVPYTRHAGADMVSAEVGGDNGEWSLWLHTRERSRQIVAYSIPPVDIADDRLGDVAELATRLNAKMFTGAFEVDLDTGGFRVRTSLSLGGVALDTSLLDGLIEPNVMAIDAALAAVDAVLSGVAPLDAVRMHPPVT
ncbi:MAG: YbjN domain-containing protein [Ilumatobacter sp.]|uniref:YbjN domain-containing protein n=1 Tax=Ilumatobacter sp. TaxID=1967498 RepID=UPI00391BD1E4